VLDSRGLANTAVVIRKDARSRAMAANELTSEVAGPANCRPDPPAGEGICASALHESRGTLGGWVELYHEPAKTWKPFALTGSHVVLPSEGAVAAADATCK
jgi:hypothetical protein